MNVFYVIKNVLLENTDDITVSNFNDFNRILRR